MQSFRLRAACAGAALVLGAAAAVASAQTSMPPTTAPMVGPTASAEPVKTMAPMPAGTPALDARALHARRTATGYTLNGEAEVNDACQAARFDRFLGNIFPPQFNATQFRRPDRMGFMCIQRLMWVTMTPRTVRSAAPPRYVTVRTRKGIVKVPVLP